MAEGNRAVVRGLNLTGLRRNIDRSDIDELKTAYKEVFESGNPIKESASKLLENSSNKHIKNFCNFILNTKRGIPFERKLNDK
jgi:UDP-N-acetylglucosamine acyltransferase